MAIKFDRIKDGIELEIRRIKNLQDNALHDQQIAYQRLDKTQAHFHSGNVHAYTHSLNGLYTLLRLFEEMEYRNEVSITVEPIDPKEV